MEYQMSLEVLAAIERVAGSWFSMMAAADSLASSIGRLAKGQEDQADANSIHQGHLVLG